MYAVDQGNRDDAEQHDYDDGIQANLPRGIFHCNAKSFISVKTD